MRRRTSVVMGVTDAAVDAAVEAEGKAATTFTVEPGPRGNVDRVRWLTAMMMLEAAAPHLMFQPLGDNHHNAAACPYCTPRPMRLLLNKDQMAVLRRFAEGGYNREELEEVRRILKELL